MPQDEEMSEMPGTVSNACSSPVETPESRAHWYSETPNRIIQYVSLLYTVFFFVHPYYQHSVRQWIGLAAFYAAFLFCYFFIARVPARWSRALLAAFFVLCFVYVPFNASAAGAFVYPVVFAAYVLREANGRRALLRFLGIMTAQIAAIFAEFYLLHISLNDAEMVTFWMVVIGMSNFAYSRQELTSLQLRLANAEIERLAQSTERERIARDLHDLLGHTLTAIAIKADLANRIFEVDPQMARREIRDVEKTARQALSEVRDAVAGYRAEGIAVEVAQARKMLAAAGVQLTTNVEPVALSDAQTNALCLALREAVTNVARHSRATGCNVELLREGEAMRLKISDNGTGGFTREGNGLSGMRERATAVGGSMRVEFPAQGGTQVVMEVPAGDARVATNSLVSA